MADTHKQIIGRYEYLEFRDFEDLPPVPAKIDTGAFRSAIHASEIEVTEDDGQEVLQFKLFGHKTSPDELPHRVDEFKQVRVVNSFGHEETRYVVKLKVRLGSKVYKTTFTLADRSQNMFPILVGRKTLGSRFLVDPALSTIDRQELREKYDIDTPEDEEDEE